MALISSKKCSFLKNIQVCGLKQGPCLLVPARLFQTLEYNNTSQTSGNLQLTFFLSSDCKAPNQGHVLDSSPVLCYQLQFGENLNKYTLQKVRSKFDILRYFFLSLEVLQPARLRVCARAVRSA